jgi:hypothetical protein
MNPTKADFLLLDQSQQLDIFDWPTTSQMGGLFVKRTDFARSLGVAFDSNKIIIF